MKHFNRTNRELILLSIGIIFVILSSISLYLSRMYQQIDAQFITLFGTSIITWIILSVIGHFGLNVINPFRDTIIFPIIATLSGIGLVTVWHLQGIYAIRYTIWYIAGIICMLASIKWSNTIKYIQQHPYLSLFIGILLTALTLLIGVSPSNKGPTLWLTLLPFDIINHKIYFQPSELLKILIITFLASYLSSQRTALILKHTKYKLMFPLTFLIPMLTIWLLITFMVIIQGDLGAGWIIYCTFITILFVRTQQKKYMIYGVVLFILAVCFVYLYSDLVKIRIHGWLEPWLQTGTNFYQITQAWLYMSNAGLIGSGIGSGQSQYIPLAHSDFIFASIVSEWGQIGGLFVILLLLILLHRIFRTAQLLKSNSFNALLISGIGILILIQSTINIGGILRILPITGVPLPYVSYGGTSMVLSYMTIGYIISKTRLLL